MSNTGGPAFPRNILDHGHGVITAHESGMTLRDYFAAKAMQGLLACPATTTRNENMYACDAYTMADAMLKAREKK
jgi:hypothetical protein